jgi:hypothetical protein
VTKALRDEVLQNEAQLAEWRELYGVNPQPTKEFLRQYPTLVVDTRHFSEDFKWRLLAHFDDLDEALDGVLIKSENFQALNLLLEKYRGKVKCIYIDPPYNTGNDEFIYKDRCVPSVTLPSPSVPLSPLLCPPKGGRGAQGKILGGKTFSLPLSHTFYGKKDGKGDDFAGIKFGLAVFWHTFHGVVYTAEKFNDKIFCGHDGSSFSFEFHLIG